MTRRLVVVGNGMAGYRFVQEVLGRESARHLEITIVGDEPGAAYNRMLLSNLLAGTTRLEAITLASQEWYARRGVRAIVGVAATRIDRARQQVHLDDGSLLAYDVLVLATGSTAIVPKVPGLHAPDGRMKRGALAFRTLHDCAEIDRIAADSPSAVVLGGGLLGLETARGLAGRGLAVRLLQRGPRLLDRQLDAGGSRALTRTARRLGIDVITCAGLRGVLGDDRVEGVELDDGRRIDAGLLVVCCGVSPRTELAAAAGLVVARGVVVDDQLRSSDPSVFAIGECAEHRGRTYGLVAPAWEQARTAARVITQDEPGAAYEGTPSVTRLKATGLELASLGDAPGRDLEAELDADLDVQGAEVVCFTDVARGVYQKLIIQDGRLRGVILVGDTRPVGTLTQLFDRQAELPADRASLLLVRRNSPTTSTDSPTTIPGRATICHCNGVTKAHICSAWQDGAKSITEIAAATRATTGCGTCRDSVEGIVDWLAAGDSGPRDPQPSSDLRVPA